MNISPTRIPGVVVIEAPLREDERGSFGRLFCEQELASVLGDRRIVQVNHSRTRTAGAIRGLHFQREPHAEMKFVRCLKGRVWDVAVDLRAGSPTFLQWHAVELSPVNANMVVIPEGCAHGFQALEADSELLYLHTAPYTPDAEGGVAWNDPRIAIAWPKSLTASAGMSARDRALPQLPADFLGLPA
jgi:dTDP-4-dehydrorhamnose 3,5-epimerase